MLSCISSVAQNVRIPDDQKTIQNYIKTIILTLWVSGIDPFLHRALLSKLFNCFLKDGDIVVLLKLIYMKLMHAKIWQ